MGSVFLQDRGATVLCTRAAELYEIRVEQRLHAFPVPTGIDVVKLLFQTPEFCKRLAIGIASVNVTFTRMHQQEVYPRLGK